MWTWRLYSEKLKSLFKLGTASSVGAVVLHARLRRFMWAGNCSQCCSLDRMSRLVFQPPLSVQRVLIGQKANFKFDYFSLLESMLNTKQNARWMLCLLFNKGTTYVPGLKMDIFYMLMYKIDKICELAFNLFSLSPISVERLFSSDM